MRRANARSLPHRITTPEMALRSGTVHFYGPRGFGFFDFSQAPEPRHRSPVAGGDRFLTGDAPMSKANKSKNKQGQSSSKKQLGKGGAQQSQSPEQGSPQRPNAGTSRSAGGKKARQ